MAGMMSYEFLPFLQIPLHDGYLHLLLFGFPVLSVYRSHREFDAEDTISLMVWGRSWDGSLHERGGGGVV